METVLMFVLLKPFTMSQDKLKLTWNSHADHLKEMLNNIMKTQELTDVTLICDDNIHIKAHKFVLSACSSVLKKIINILQSTGSVIYLKGIQHEEMESMMEFMYNGEVSIPKEKMNNFFHVANVFDVKEVSTIMEFDDCNYDELNETKEVDANTLDLVGGHLETLAENNSDFHKDSNQVISCRQCEYQCKTKSSLKVHMKNHRPKMNACSECPYKTHYRSILDKHIQSLHENIKYKCNQCEFQFTRKDHLKNHTRTQHEGESRYFCEQCDFLCNRQSLLNYHIESKHKGIKYLCDQCENLFTSQHGLKKHIMSIHEGIKRYACEQCDYKTNEQKLIQKHIKSKHEDIN